MRSIVGNEIQKINPFQSKTNLLPTQYALGQMGAGLETVAIKNLVYVEILESWPQAMCTITSEDFVSYYTHTDFGTFESTRTEFSVSYDANGQQISSSDKLW